MDGNLRRVGYAWSSMDRELEEIKTDIIHTGFKPQIIVGLSRGGLIPAVNLSHKMKIPMMPIVWQTRDGSLQQWDELEEILVKHDRVLIVDDICDSGLTLKQISTKIDETCGDMVDVKYAVCIHNVGCEVFTPDYVGTIFNRKLPNQNVYWDFPWER